jgi:hypothetical protein
VVSWTKQRAALKIPFVFTVDFEFGFSLSLLSIRFFLISMPEKVSQTQASDKLASNKRKREEEGYHHEVLDRRNTITPR